MTTSNDDLEPIEPNVAFKRFIDHKKSACAEATVRNYRYRLQYFLEWCEDNGIDNLNDLNDLTGRDLQQFHMWRKNSKDLAETTIRNHLCSLRVFLKWAASIEAVPPNLYDKLIIPQVGHGDRHREEMLDSDTAQELLDYLRKYHFASTEHVVIVLLWETGMRIGAAMSINLQDVDFDDERIDLQHRPEEDTPLKNGTGGERPIAITPELTELLPEYVENRRRDVTDDNGRRPLLTTSEGRMHRSTIREIVYRVTAPCFRDLECPDCNKDTTKTCPEAVYPHAIRRGSITHFLSEDVPVEILSDRMNESPIPQSSHQKLINGNPSCLPI
ncbi:tyrosine-type recombinase/integrase [Salinibaculum salinum]|uniref:tyrosine-type recombinase/integrase n=1 Tax=Salinibaculum salinum TaxID=3131996 RepID=UPI0030EB3BC1